MADLARAFEPRPLEIAIIPNLSARTLFTAYEPMRRYLETRIGRPVKFYTAPNFYTYFKRTVHGDYDVIICPPHFAWAGQQEAGYVPLVQYRQELKSLLIVHDGSSISRLEDLRGATISAPDVLALATMKAMRTLRENNLRRNIEVVIRDYASHNSAALAVQQREVAAAIVGSGPYRIMPEQFRKGTHVVLDFGGVPNATFMAHPRLGSHVIEQLKSALLDFADKTEEGKAFMARYQYDGFRVVGKNELHAMAEYTEEAKRIVEAHP